MAKSKNLQANGPFLAFYYVNTIIYFVVLHKDDQMVSRRRDGTRQLRYNHAI